MRYFVDHLEEQLKDPEFREEWEKTEDAYQVTRALIAARIEKKVSQRELARRANTTQAVVSRIENMSASPSVKTLAKLAKALDKKLEIKFV